MFELLTTYALTLVLYLKGVTETDQSTIDCNKLIWAVQFNEVLAGIQKERRERIEQRNKLSAEHSLLKEILESDGNVTTSIEVSLECDELGESPETELLPDDAVDNA